MSPQERYAHRLAWLVVALLALLMVVAVDTIDPCGPIRVGRERWRVTADRAVRPSGIVGLTGVTAAIKGAA